MLDKYLKLKKEIKKLFNQNTFRKLIENVNLGEF